MFLKSKIGLTILSLYEIAAVLLLHCPRTCDAMFGAAFCDDHIFKYFVACIAVPLLVFLIAMWIMDIIHRIRVEPLLDVSIQLCRIAQIIKVIVLEIDGKNALLLDAVFFQTRLKHLHER